MPYLFNFVASSSEGAAPQTEARARLISIRKARTGDLERVLMWSKVDAVENREGSFWCNRAVIDELFREQQDECLVADMDDDVAIGFMTPDFSILSVSYAFRGNGVGTALAEHAIQAAKDAGDRVARVECAPSSSLPFWERFGFVAYRGPYAYKTFPYALDVGNIEGPSVNVEVCFFPEAALYSKGVVEPCVTFTRRGVRDATTGTVYLREGVFFFEDFYRARDPELGNPVVRVRVDGADVGAMRKCKYAADVGVERDRWGFVVSAVLLA